MTGRILGDRYQVQQVLNKTEGRGTLLALDLQTQESVIIKLLLCRQGEGFEDLKFLKREAETLKVLNHPAIPCYLNFFELNLRDGQGVALVQSYNAGKSLQEYLDGDRLFSEAEARQIASATLQILIYLHEQTPPILHRDIKPSNILLAPHATNRLGQIYLINFDSAQNFAPRAAGSFTVIGTYGYSPPELTGGRALKASDLYSLGVTLISILTGIDPAKLPRKGARIHFEQTVYLSPSFTEWLRQMVEPSLDRRFTSAEEALKSLENKQQHPVKTIQKPKNSRIVLTKHQDALEITIPLLIGRMRLRIDQQISQTRELFGFNYRHHPLTQRRDIWKLEVAGSCIIIWAGSQQYNLGTQQHLTHAELTWLAYELSQWLRLPIVN